MPLYIDETSNINIDILRKKCRILVKTYNVKVIIIDYLQLIEGTSKQNSRTAEISDISKKLKFISKELNIPVIVISQLNRNVENRFDKVPLMSDLRESGTIEQDADMIFFLYRQEYYLKKNNDINKNGLTEIILSKNRNGPTGKIFIKFFESIVKFVNLTDI